MNKIIELTQGQVAIVDDQDFEFLKQFKWIASYDKKLKGYYAVRNKHIGTFNGKQKKKAVQMHREIMELRLNRKLDKLELIDHVNHNPLDNRYENLRIVSNRQNQQNRKDCTSSKFSGVYWEKQCGKWKAQIQLNGKRKHLGLFSDEREAAKAYEKACREMVGEELVCKVNRGVV